jgi:hypothetical protein
MVQDALGQIHIRGEEDVIPVSNQKHIKKAPEQPDPELVAELEKPKRK